MGVNLQDEQELERSTAVGRREGAEVMGRQGLDLSET